LSADPLAVVRLLDGQHPSSIATKSETLSLVTAAIENGDKHTKN
jgi:hypothetical protein